LTLRKEGDKKNGGGEGSDGEDSHEKQKKEKAEIFAN
jgi:hypothetical protein